MGTPLIKGRSPRLSAPPLSRGAGGIGTPLIKGDPPIKGGSAPPLSRGIPPPIGTPLIKGRSPRLSAPPLLRGD
ncbi:MAG: hypothetical protein EWV60_08435 [Microcystis sp. Msp_OC_L_20101000_S702]|nr:MAG: hypothetical protein EWV60_08435 [Microcystis sp. Msp_OC_L_20101000_S702]